MMEDIRHQLMLQTSTGATADAYLAVPYNCTLRDIIGTCQADPGDGEVITVTENSAGTILGTYTFGSSIAAGATGTWAANATTGDHVIVAGEVLKFQITQCSAAVWIHLNIELDNACR